MTSERGSSDSSDVSRLLDFEGLNLSDIARGKPKHRHLERISKSANCSFCSSQSEETFIGYMHETGVNTSIRQTKFMPGFAYELPPIGIYWDIENVRVPKMKNAAGVVQKIRSVFLENYRESEFVVVCDVKKEPSQLVQDLHDSQINVIHVSSMSKNAADEKLRQSIRRFADIHPAPSAIILISGDVNFASDLADLRYRKKVHIILIHNEHSVSDALITCANEHYSLSSLTDDLPIDIGRRTVDDSTGFFLTIINLPKHVGREKLKKRLKYLTYNCGGKVVEFLVGQGSACVKFGTFELASRAQKRIQGEDVFGQKIKVLPPTVRYTGQRVKNADLSFSQQQGPYNSAPLPGFQIGGYQFGNVAPPPGFESQSHSYPYNAYNMRKQDVPMLRTPPIILGKAGPPNFRPITKIGARCPSPMDYDQLQGAFHRRTPLSRQSTPQEQLSAGLGLGACFGRAQAGAMEMDSDEKGYVSSDSNTRPQSNQPVDLNITNLDPTIEVKELRRLLTNMIKEYAMILNLNVIVQADGTPVASLRVSSQQEAQFVISQLHRQKLGHKRIVISYEQDNAPDPEQLKVMVVSVLQDVPDRRMPLFKFMELLESRYHCTVSVSEVNKLKDVVRITDERGSRMISLTEDANVSENLSQTMLPQCIIHCPKSMQNIGWCELNSSFIPNILVSLSIFAPKLLALLEVHCGSMPLLSFQTCYEQEYQEQLPVNENGVPLEHLVTCVPNIEIKLVGPNKSIKVVHHEVKSNEETSEDQVLKTVAPPLAPNVNLLCREVVDLLKNMDRCQILLTKFIPAYHHHFGRQCRVAEYGYTKLIDLFEAISHVVQIMGDGYRRVITLTHAAQMRRFTSDLLRVLKVQPNKQIAMQDFGGAYERALGKSFNPVEYGLCTLDDLLHEIPENTVVISRSDDGGLFISVPKREQTPEEAMRTKQFANEVIDLLRHTPYNTMLFHKFVPSYHHHFGYQCKVSDYGFTKLIELFEAIPDVVEIKELPDGDRAVSLTMQESLKILGSQVVQVIRSAGTVELQDLPRLYFREFGYRLNPHAYQCDGLEEIVDKLADYVQVIHSNAGSLLRAVEMDTSPNILRVRCWALLLGPPHVKDLNEFRYEYRQCYNNTFTIDALRNISNVVSLSTMNNTEYISLTSLFVLAAQLYFVICDRSGSVEYNELERAYEEYYGKPLKLSSFNINTVNEFYNKFNLILYVRGSKKRSVVVLNKNLQEHIAFKYESNARLHQNPMAENQWNKTGFSANQETVKKYSPPKPDTPPTPGSTLWWNSPGKFDQSSLNFSIKMPITVDPTLLRQSDHLISPARYLLPIGTNPWRNAQTEPAPPEPHELPIPEKLLPKGMVSDDSGDSGVNIMLDNSPSDNETERSTEHQGAIKKKPMHGRFLSFK